MSRFNVNEIRQDPQEAELRRPALFKSVPIKWPSLHIITGRPGEGKGVLAFNIADRYHQETKNPCYTVGKETDADPRELGAPAYYSLIKTREGQPLRLPTNALVIGDDWQRVAPSRRAMSNVNVAGDEILGLIRHYDLTVVLDTQTAVAFDRNTILRCDYFWIKAPYRKELEFSRPELRGDIEQAFTRLDGKSEAERWDSVYLVDNLGGTAGVVKGIPLPPYYNDELSKLHRPRIKRWSLW